VFLALAAACAVTGADVHRRRDFATALGIAAFAFALPASIWLLDGTWLVLAWAAAAAVLVLLARFEPRLEIAALTCIALASGHALRFEAAPADALIARGHPGSGVPALLLVIDALVVFVRDRTVRRDRLCWLCGAVALYAATLGILEASEDLGGTVSSAFQRGHTAVSAVWAVVGLALLVLGLRRSRALQSRSLQIGGFALFGISLAKLFLYDLAFLTSIARAFSFVAVGMLILVGGFFYQRMALDSRT
jgi:NADH:ubiquinone oxidoreductase subunit K